MKKLTALCLACGVLLSAHVLLAQAISRLPDKSSTITASDIVSMDNGSPPVTKRAPIAQIFGLYLPLSPVNGGTGPNIVWGSIYASLNAAITAIGSTPATLMVSSALPLTANVTVPATLGVEVAQAGSLVLNGYSLTFSGGYFNAAGRAIAAGSSSLSPGQVTGLKWARPEWFGDVAASGAPINCAIYAVDNATTGPGQVIFSRGTYDVGGNNPIVASIRGRGANLIGAGEYATVLTIQVGGSKNGITYTIPRPMAGAAASGT